MFFSAEKRPREHQQARAARQIELGAQIAAAPRRGEGVDVDSERLDRSRVRTPMLCR